MSRRSQRTDARHVASLVVFDLEAKEIMDGLERIRVGESIESKSRDLITVGF